MQQNYEYDHRRAENRAVVPWEEGHLRNPHATHEAPAILESISPLPQQGRKVMRLTLSHIDEVRPAARPPPNSSSRNPSRLRCGVPVDSREVVCGNSMMQPFADLVPPIAHHFVVNLMSNHTDDEKNGYLNRDILKTFFAISGEDGAHVWNKGQEQIPQNWYRRPSSDPYGAVPAVVSKSLRRARGESLTHTGRCPHSRNQISRYCRDWWQHRHRQFLHRC